VSLGNLIKMIIHDEWMETPKGHIIYNHTSHVLQLL